MKCWFDAAAPCSAALPTLPTALRDPLLRRCGAQWLELAMARFPVFLLVLIMSVPLKAEF